MQRSWYCGQPDGVNVAEELTRDRAGER